MTTREPRVFTAPCHKLGNSPGFSMIEVLVSLSLIALSLLGMAALLGTTHKNAASSQLRTQASILGADIAEKMRANRESFLANPSAYTQVPEDCSDVAGASGTVELDLRQFACLVKSALPQGKATITFEEATGILTVIVGWDDSRGTEGSANHEFKYQTRL
jgi:type IV pilus assembly protein PilV